MNADGIKVTLDSEQARRLSSEIVELTGNVGDVDIEFIYDPNDDHVVEWVLIPVQSPLACSEGGQA